MYLYCLASEFEGVAAGGVHVGLAGVESVVVGGGFDAGFGGFFGPPVGELFGAPEFGQGGGHRGKRGAGDGRRESE